MKKYGFKYAATVLLLSAVTVLFVVVYKKFDPSDFSFFPKCPSKLITGFDCPGCGSQRAIHHLLNLEFGEAVKDNLLVVIFFPYIIAGFVFEIVKSPAPNLLLWRKRLFGVRAIYAICVVIALYTVMRNIL